MIPRASERLRIVKQGLRIQVLRQGCKSRPLSSEVLREQLRQRKYPHWTAWYVPYCDVKNDLWGKSHFNFEVDEKNYHILRTGAFPFVKFHCTRRQRQDLTLEDNFYRVLKVLNCGIPTLLYGISGLLWAKHTDIIQTSQGALEIETRLLRQFAF